MVVDFQGIKVQFPSCKDIRDYVYVEHDKEKYTLTTKEQYEKSLESMSAKKQKKTKPEIPKLENKNVSEINDNEISE
jgi:hypothetical protein